MVIHDELLEALQLPEQPAGPTLTVTVPVPPAEVAFALDGDKDRLHDGGGAPNVQVSDMTTRSWYEKPSFTLGLFELLYSSAVIVT
jgi:hypothetical protein